MYKFLNKVDTLATIAKETETDGRLLFAFDTNVSVNEFYI